MLRSLQILALGFVYGAGSWSVALQWKPIGVFVLGCVVVFSIGFLLVWNTPFKYLRKSGKILFCTCILFLSYLFVTIILRKGLPGAWAAAISACLVCLGAYLSWVDRIRTEEKAKIRSDKYHERLAQDMANEGFGKLGTEIKGPIFSGLWKAIEAFPLQYPEYATRLPKLDADIRPWLEKENFATSKREAHVFGAILAEHFNISPDTQKSQQ